MDQKAQTYYLMCPVGAPFHTHGDATPTTLTANQDLRIEAETLEPSVQILCEDLLHARLTQSLLKYTAPKPVFGDSIAENPTCAATPKPVHCQRWTEGMVAKTCDACWLQGRQSLFQQALLDQSVAGKDFYGRAS